MTQIEVPDWVVETALLASFRVACEHTGTEFSDDEFRNARDENDRENRNVASDMMRAALTAALGAWVVPQQQCMCTDEDELPNGPRDIWMDVSADDFKSLTERNDVRGRTLYTLRQEKPE